MVPERVRKRRKLSPPDELSFEEFSDSAASNSEALQNNSFLTHASRWSLEQDYETKPRKLKKKEKENTRLPIKTAEGRIEHVEHPVEAEEDGDSWLDSGADERGDSDHGGSLPAPKEPQKSDEEQIAEAKVELARIALAITEDPEENAGGFKSLARWSESPNHVVKQLALATQMTIYKDVIPGYRIRPLGDKELVEKVSKEVKKRRAFEQGLVHSYKNYVDMLAKCAGKGGRTRSEEGNAVANIAISCACELLLTVSHFNFRSELIKTLANKLGQRDHDDQFTKCRTTIETLFREDEDGNASLDAVTALTRMIKARDYKVDESVLNTFLHLRLLTELSVKASQDSVDKADETKGKKPKQKREIRSKRQRKALRELKAVEKDFREADAIASHQERDRLQGETLKLVFGTYFRILKARSPNLTGAVLEGLARFAHLINQDFFGDLLEVLRELAQKAASSLDPAFSANAEDDEILDDNDEVALSMDPARTALLCTTTAFSLLSAQDASRLSLDLSSFTSLLYTLLLHVLSLHPDLEFSHKTLRLADPHATNKSSEPMTNDSAPKVNVATNSTLLIRALSAALTPRSTPPTRLASFTHRLMTTTLHTPEKTSRAILGLLTEITRSQGRKVSPLWNSEERTGDGQFDPLGDMENCRPFCGNVWEGELLKYHYSDGVREGVGQLEKLVAGLV